MIQEIDSSNFDGFEKKILGKKYFFNVSNIDIDYYHINID